AGIHVWHGGKTITLRVKNDGMRIARVVSDMPADNKYSSVRKLSMPATEQRVRGSRCCRKGIACRVPDMRLQRLVVIRDEENAPIGQKCGVDGAGRPGCK